MSRLADMNVPYLTAHIIASVQQSIKQSQEEVLIEASERAVNMMQQCLESKRKEITNEAVKESVKRVKVEQPEFKNAGNKNQFDHNLQVLESMNTVKDHVEAGRQKEGLEELENGKKIILKRQKLIRLADREENGWHVVKEYVADDLASDSDDEKSILKARKSAADKKKAFRENKKQKYNYNRDSKPYLKTTNRTSLFTKRAVNNDYAKCELKVRIRTQSK